jgi:trimeric autotransporter adhesin
LQAKLLKKIEELTLYVIELKKENEALNRKLGKIEKNDGRMK